MRQTLYNLHHTPYTTSTSAKTKAPKTVEGDADSSNDPSNIPVATPTLVPVLKKKNSNVDGSSVMRLVRMLMILVLAGYTGMFTYSYPYPHTHTYTHTRTHSHNHAGFRVVQQSKHEALVNMASIPNTSVNMVRYCVSHGIHTLNPFAHPIRVHIHVHMHAYSNQLTIPIPIPIPIQGL